MIKKDERYMLPLEAKEWIYSNIKEGSIILELGSGYGTEELSKKYNMFSIEHNPEWINLFNSNYIKAEIKNRFYNISDIIKKIPKNIDLLIIDGPPDSLSNRSKFLGELSNFCLDCPIIINDVNRKDEMYLLSRLTSRIGRESFVHSSKDGRKFGIIRGIENKVVNIKETSILIDNTTTIDQNNNEAKDNKSIDGISVIISAYQAQDFIEECLDSVAKQKTNFKYEILLGIDGCEKTLEKVKEIMNKYIHLDFHVYYSEENVGTYILCNSLIEKSKYNYFARFDSDDIMMENHLEYNIKYLNEYDAIYPKANIIGENRIIPTIGLIFLNKKKFLEINGFDNFRISGDLDLKERLKRNKNKIKESDKSTLYRRVHENSLQHSKETGMLSETRRKINHQIKNRNDIKISIFKITTINEIHYINSYFDQIYCINLDRRIDRWNVLNDKFKKLGLNIKRISGVDGNLLDANILKKYINRSKGEVGCMLSHYNVIEDAKKNNYKRILVFEDDILFIEDFHNKFNEKIKNISKDWVLLYLGATQHSIINEYYKDYYIPHKTDGTFGIGIDYSIYNEILSTKETDYPIDNKLHNIQEKYNNKCFVLFPNLIISDVSDSDIREGRDNNEFRKKMKWNLENYENSKPNEKKRVPNI